MALLEIAGETVTGLPCFPSHMATPACTDHLLPRYCLPAAPLSNPLARLPTSPYPDYPAWFPSPAQPPHLEEVPRCTRLALLCLQEGPGLQGGEGTGGEGGGGESGEQEGGEGVRIGEGKNSWRGQRGSGDQGLMAGRAVPADGRGPRPDTKCVNQVCRASG